MKKELRLGEGLGGQSRAKHPPKVITNYKGNNLTLFFWCTVSFIPLWSVLYCTVLYVNCTTVCKLYNLHKSRSNTSNEPGALGFMYRYRSRRKCNSRLMSRSSDLGERITMTLGLCLGLVI